ncbi:MAG TPA: universal stress protein [Vicinamibacterales bacterium]|nr:universal stress protein [Vicinamibacterales bacterium]
MIEIRRILCPIDFSDFSRHALDHAVAIAKWYGSTITLFNVAPLVPAIAYAPGTPMLPVTVPTPDDLDALLASMKRFAAVETAGSVPMQFEIGEGDAAAEILDRSNAIPSDLVVMGTHGRSGFERLILGSVTEKVLRQATCPVLTVPRNSADAVPAPPVLFTRILCAIDFSECSMHALDYAVSLAQEAEAHLTVAHVIEVPSTIATDVDRPITDRPRSLREYVAEVEEDRRAQLTQAVPDTVRTYCPVETVLATGKPYQEILRIAAEQKSELIVIGIHGRGGVDLLFFGSTTQHVVRRASCPVLTLRKG